MRIKWPLIIFLFFSIYVCNTSFNLGLGTLRKPGPGFISFWSGVSLGILTLILLIQDVIVSKLIATQKENKETPKWKNVIFTVIGLFICILIFERVGFIISTFLFTGFLLKVIEKKGWLITIMASFIMTAGSYYIFKILLQAELPKGILGF